MIRGRVGGLINYSAIGIVGWRRVQLIRLLRRWAETRSESELHRLVDVVALSLRRHFQAYRAKHVFTRNNNNM